MRKPIWMMSVVFLLVACIFAWAVAAMDYGDRIAAGTYSFEANGESSTLVLSLNHTFRQTRRLGGNEQRSQGTWRRVGEGGISFSKEFLVVPGDEPEPDGTTFSDMHKAFGVFTSLRLRQYHILWYGKKDSDKSMLGRYTGDEPGVSSTLILNEDHFLVRQ